MSATISDHDDDDYAHSPPPTWRSDKDENAFIGFLGQLGTLEFDLPMCPYHIYQFANVQVAY